ncbi:PadR family transcriptional regulator [Sorangium sp. So ce260]|uniref:PadR family transcriptional regulator n=1 Tax=Sorangium sp. So ce260 TaxID=3133291 RepID=UPI003F5D66AD
MTADERALLLLGLLKTQRSHGYEIHDFIERNLNRIADMRKPTAYATLDRLAREGLVDVATEQVGNRPPRKVYTVTAAGEARFQTLLREGLRVTEPIRFLSNVTVMFLDKLPADEAARALRDRLAECRRLLELHEGAPRHDTGLGVDLALDHYVAHLRAECAWLEAAIATLAQQGPRARAGAGRRARRT